MPGLWLKDVQQSLHPYHKLVGTDINPSFFPSSSPPNTTFQVQDITKPWPKECKSSFDLVHSRLGLAGCGDFPVEQAVKNMIHLVKPGGWIQLDEMEVNKVTEIKGTAGEFGRLLKAMFEASGVQWDFAGSLKGWLHEERMVRVEERIIDVAYGKKCEDAEIAKMSVESMVTGMKAVSFGAKSKLFSLLQYLY
jgi:SAM-dependent methyltransferase